ncbi:toprim domain-containing protein [bacterium]|nr:toprim domain-containing protein [bacterium]
MSNNTLDSYLAKLPQYLETYGIKLVPGRTGKCPIKEHKSNQTGIGGTGNSGDPVWNCFACGEGGAIFELASAIHGYPKANESGFYDVTVRHLSDVLDLPFPEVNLAPKSTSEKFKDDLYSATREIANHLSPDVVKEYCDKRGWNTSILKEFNIGGIADYDQLVTYLRTKYSEKVLKTVGIVSKTQYQPYFAEKRVFFTIHDKAGRPVGFTARAVNYSTGTTRKYVNSSSSPIFKKRNLLYNVHRARQALDRDSSKILYLVEGQADAVSLSNNGIRAVVAISGTSFTNEHIELIKDFDLVVGCLDADDGGNKATRKMYSKYEELTGKTLKLMQLPSGLDPDDYITKHGIDSFLSIDVMLPVEWEIINEYVIRGKLLVDYWLPRIINLNSIYHSRILKVLSNKSGIDYSELHSQLTILLAQEISDLLSNGILDNKISLHIERA